MKTICVCAVIGLLLACGVRAADAGKSASMPIRVEIVQTNFNFQGGSLAEWIDQVNKVYKVDLYTLGNIDSDVTREIRVPKMRLGNINYQGALLTYNNLSLRGAEGLGKWIWMGTAEEPQVIAYQPSEQHPKLGARVKAYHIKMSPQKFEELLKIVEETWRKANERVPSNRGSLRFHSDSDIVVAIGDEAYLEIVSEIINALKDRPRF